MSDDDFVRRLRAMRDVPPWMMHLTFDAPLRVQRARREWIARRDAAMSDSKHTRNERFLDALVEELQTMNPERTC